MYWINVPVQTSDPQTSDFTKVGQYKRRTVQPSDLQTSDWYKRRTSTNVGPVQTSDGYIYKKKRQTLVDFEKKTIAIRNKLKSLTYCDENRRQLNKVSYFEGSTV